MDECYHGQKTNNGLSQQRLGGEMVWLHVGILKILLISAKGADIDLLQHLGTRKGKW